VTANEKAMAQVKAIGELLDPIGAGKITAGGGGADIGPITREGVPAFGLRTVGERYWEWHHTAADTLDKIVPEDFRKNIAAIAVMSYVLADMPERLGQ
jgi:carboxypeptidase Q